MDALGVAQVWVPAGEFQMGTAPAEIEALKAAGPPEWVISEFPSEQPRHLVRLTTGYWIDRSEVTVAAFRAFVLADGYSTQALWSPDGWTWVSARNPAGLPKRCAGDLPEVPQRCITWYEAEAYAAWRGGALPTEAQWEYAARGPESLIYPWGNDWDTARANVVGSAAPLPVGTYPTGASWVGALDMAGNAMEWVADWLSVDYYATSAVEDPTGPEAGQRKVEKGGWWGSNQFVARSAYRHYEDPPTYGDKHIGFRVVSR
ncbi:MAG: SUMF1/EgtB/PvdO family nonheme iron enzyme [Chloroflexota bacterium]